MAGNHVIWDLGGALGSGFAEIAVFTDPATQVDRAMVLGGHSGRLAGEPHGWASPSLDGALQRHTLSRWLSPEDVFCLFTRDC